MQNETEDRMNVRFTPTIDGIVNDRFDKLTEIVKDALEHTYKTFNNAMAKKDYDIKLMEEKLTKMVQVLWGIVNQQTTREAALETVLIRNGMDQDELMREIERVVQRMKDEQDFVESTISKQATESNPKDKNIETGPSDVPPLS